jgi:hypothetical protein
MKPALKNNGTPWRTVRSDHFDTDSLGAWWHFLTKRAAGNYSLTIRKGWVRLMPDSGLTHLVQKETDHYYSAVTKVDLGKNPVPARGGIYLTNGNQRVFVRLFYTSANDKGIVLQLDTALRKVSYNNKGAAVWLKLERQEHLLTGYYSADGKKWLPVGAPVNAVPLDKTQPNYNSWVGTSVGLFAEGGAVDFDYFICKDGFSPMPAVGSNNHYGIQKGGGTVTNQSTYGGWLMISGVDFGKAGEAKAIEVEANTQKGGVVEILLDDLQEGTQLAAVPIKPGKTGTHVYSLRRVKGVSGQHDLFIRFPTGNQQDIFIKSVRLRRD